MPSRTEQPKKALLGKNRRVLGQAREQIGIPRNALPAHSLDYGQALTTQLLPGTTTWLLFAPQLLPPEQGLTPCWPIVQRLDNPVTPGPHPKQRRIVPLHPFGQGKGPTPAVVQAGRYWPPTNVVPFVGEASDITAVTAMTPNSKRRCVMVTPYSKKERSV